jgi:hypothetical protein
VNRLVATGHRIASRSNREIRLGARFVAAAVVIGFPYALYLTYKKRPDELRRECDRLDENDRDLEE